MVLMLAGVLLASPAKLVEDTLKKVDNLGYLHLDCEESLFKTAVFKSDTHRVYINLCRPLSATVFEEENITADDLDNLECKDLKGHILFIHDFKGERNVILHRVNQTNGLRLIQGKEPETSTLKILWMTLPYELNLSVKKNSSMETADPFVTLQANYELPAKPTPKGQVDIVLYYTSGSETVIAGIYPTSKVAVFLRCAFLCLIGLVMMVPERLQKKVEVLNINSVGFHLLSFYLLVNVCLQYTGAQDPVVNLIALVSIPLLLAALLNAEKVRSRLATATGAQVLFFCLFGLQYLYFGLYYTLTCLKNDSSVQPFIMLFGVPPLLMLLALVVSGNTPREVAAKGCVALSVSLALIETAFATKSYAWRLGGAVLRNEFFTELKAAAYLLFLLLPFLLAYTLLNRASKPSTDIDVYATLHRDPADTNTSATRF
jgi:hypothetical protein